MFFQQKTEKISRVKKIKSFFQDRYHLLFKGAAENHLRIQNALKNPDGTYELTIKFDSYTDLKKYQKKLRRMTVSLSGALAMMIVAVIVAPYLTNPNKSAASNFTWIQNSWAGTAGATSATKSGWTGYVSKDTDVVAAAGGVSLNLPAASVAAYSGDYTGDSTVGFFIDPITKQLTLSKADYFPCSANGECATGSCTCNTCGATWAASPCGFLVAKTEGTAYFWDASTKCAAMSGRLPTVAQLQCLYANKALYGGTCGFSSSAWYFSSQTGSQSFSNGLSGTSVTIFNFVNGSTSWNVLTGNCGWNCYSSLLQYRCIK